MLYSFSIVSSIYFELILRYVSNAVDWIRCVLSSIRKINWIDSLKKEIRSVLETIIERIHTKNGQTSCAFNAHTFPQEFNFFSIYKQTFLHNWHSVRPEELWIINIFVVFHPQRNKQTAIIVTLVSGTKIISEIC